MSLKINPKHKTPEPSHAQVHALNGAAVALVPIISPADGNRWHKDENKITSTITEGFLRLCQVLTYRLSLIINTGCSALG